LLFQEGALVLVDGTAEEGQRGALVLQDAAANGGAESAVEAVADARAEAFVAEGLGDFAQGGFAIPRAAGAEDVPNDSEDFSAVGLVDRDRGCGGGRGLCAGFGFSSGRFVLGWFRGRRRSSLYAKGRSSWGLGIASSACPGRLPLATGTEVDPAEANAPGQPPC